MFRILFGQFKPAVLFIAAVVSLGTASVAHANKAETCYNFLAAQDYPRAASEAKMLLKIKGLAREDERSVQNCLGLAYSATGRFRDALPALLRVEALSNSTEGLAGVYMMLGMTYQKIGDLNRAELYAQRAVMSYKKLDDKSGESVSLLSLAELVKIRGDTDRALVLYRESLDLAPNEEGKPTALNNIALIHIQRRELVEAVKLLREAIDISRRQSNGHVVAMCQLTLGAALREQGDFAGAEQELTAGLNAVQLIGDRGREALAYRYLGELRFRQDRLAEAKNLTQKAIEISRVNGTMDVLAVQNLDFFNKQ